MSEVANHSVISALLRVMAREFRCIVCHWLYPLCMIGMPLFGMLFYATMLQEGLPERIPTAVVDCDNSSLSRSFIRDLQAQQSLEIVQQYTSYVEARNAMQRNEIYGFLLIPSLFEALVMDGKQPAISFYTNDAYLIPGSLLYECYSTQSTLASADIVEGVLNSLGVSQQRILSLLQPLAVDLQALGNSRINYSIYLTNSFIPTLLQLMILLVTIYAFTSEIKHESVRAWVFAARGSLPVAVVGKILVYAIIFCVEGLLLQSLLYGYMHFPLQSPWWQMSLAMILMVAASMSIVVIVLSLVPSVSVSYSIVSVIGVVSFSLGGFSYPVSDMYLPFKILTNLLPARHYFLIYVNNALNGYPLYYCRWQYVALLIFVIAALFSLPRLCGVIARNNR